MAKLIGTFVLDMLLFYIVWNLWFVRVAGIGELGTILQAAAVVPIAWLIQMATAGGILRLTRNK